MLAKTLFIISILSIIFGFRENEFGQIEPKRSYFSIMLFFGAGFLGYFNSFDKNYLYSRISLYYIFLMFILLFVSIFFDYAKTEKKRNLKINSILNFAWENNFSVDEFYTIDIGLFILDIENKDFIIAQSQNKYYFSCEKYSINNISKIEEKELNYRHLLKIIFKDNKTLEITTTNGKRIIEILENKSFDKGKKIPKKELKRKFKEAFWQLSQEQQELEILKEEGILYLD